MLGNVLWGNVLLGYVLQVNVLWGNVLLGYVLQGNVLLGYVFCKEMFYEEMFY